MKRMLRVGGLVVGIVLTLVGFGGAALLGWDDVYVGEWGSVAVPGLWRLLMISGTVGVLLTAIAVRALRRRRRGPAAASSPGFVIPAPRRGPDDSIPRVRQSDRVTRAR